MIGSGGRTHSPAHRAGVVGCLLLGIAFFLAGPSAFAASGQAQQPQVLVVTIDGTITPVMADHVVDAVSQAEDNGYDALVAEIDTPGGLDSSMRKIIQRFLAAEVPVVAYVSPDGARAASAGSLIASSANIAAMAPGTAIGAATPVQLGGDAPSDSERKAINDAAAFAESVAQARGRGPDAIEFAIDSVREGRSIGANEALDLGVVDLIVGSLPELLEEIDGLTVTVAGDRTVTLTTADAAIDTAEMGLFRSIQQFLADPNLAFLFLSLGTLGIIYELANPGLGGAGIVGITLIILALFGIAVLPVNVVGLLFLLLAAILFVAELFAPGIGVAAAGGTASLMMSGIFLFRDAPGFEVSMWVMVPIAVVVGGAVLLAGRLVVRTRGVESTTTGTGLYIGREVTVRKVDGVRGKAFVDGAWWNVRAEQGRLAEGLARIVEMDGLTFVVTSDDEQPTDRVSTDKESTSRE